jgi:tetratricopeptide (TPR) repeat protein
MSHLNNFGVSEKTLKRVAANYGRGLERGQSVPVSPTITQTSEDRPWVTGTGASGATRLPHLGGTGQEASKLSASGGFQASRKKYRPLTAPELDYGAPQPPSADSGDIKMIDVPNKNAARRAESNVSVIELRESTQRLHYLDKDITWTYDDCSEGLPFPFPDVQAWNPDMARNGESGLPGTAVMFPGPPPPTPPGTPPEPPPPPGPKRIGNGDWQPQPPDPGIASPKSMTGGFSIAPSFAPSMTNGFAPSGFAPSMTGMTGMTTGGWSTGTPEALAPKSVALEDALTKKRASNANFWFKMAERGGGTVKGHKFDPSQCYVKALEANPELAEAWHGLSIQGGGMICGQEFSQAECCVRALEIDPKCTRAWQTLGNHGGGVVSGVLLSRNECFGRAVNANTENAQVWYTLGKHGGTVNSVGQHLSKGQCYMRALEIDPRHAYAWNNLGNSGGGSVGGCWRSPIECYITSLELNPRNACAWKNLGNRGGGTVGEKHYFPAQCYIQALEANPKYVKAWYNLGICGGGLVNQNRYSGTQCYIRTLELDPMYDKAWYNLGLQGGATVDGRLYSAADCYAKAAEINPKDRDIWHNLGMAGGGHVFGEFVSSERCMEVKKSIRQSESAREKADSYRSQ